MKVFIDGMPEWKKKGNLVASSVINLKDSMDKNIPHVLIDIRPADAAKKEHIKGAVSIFLSELAQAKDGFPADKKAPIIICCDTQKLSEDAFKIVRKWGYSNLAYLAGGIEAWKKAGNPVASNELKTAIVYVPKPKPGEISVDDFKKIAETLPPDKLILDVRDKDETMRGIIKGAKNIPAKDAASRLSEIPKDREIIIHCTTGARAEMVYHTLKDAGYKALFLNAVIKVESNGTYGIFKE
ncbi:MAG: rhodanese-like domain-containing protein [Nitrospirota bacterium]